MWLLAATILLVGVVGCGVVVLRGGLIDRLVALELAGVLVVLILLLLAQGTQRPSFEDLGLALALLSFPGSLAFARLLGRR